MSSLEKAVSSKVIVFANNRGSKEKVNCEKLQKDPVRLSNWVIQCNGM